MSKVVYFAFTLQLNAAKVGLSTMRRAIERIAEVQTGCPDFIHKTIVIPATEVMNEANAKSLLSAHRIRGEWFDDSCGDVSALAEEWLNIARRVEGITNDN